MVQLFGTFSSGDTLGFDVDLGVSVEELKCLLSKKTGVAETELRISVESRELVTGSLTDNHVKPMSTLDINTKLRGGMMKAFAGGVASGAGYQVGTACCTIS